MTPPLPSLLERIRHTVHHSIGRRMAVYILMFSSLVTLISTATQLGLEYQRDVRDIETQFEQIRRSYSDTLASAVWNTNQKDLGLQLQGILRLPDIEYVEVVSDLHQPLASAGRIGEGKMITRSFPLYTVHRGTKLTIGQVSTTASMAGVYRRLEDKVIVILIAQTIKTFLVSLFILFLFHWLVGRHLKKIAGYAGLDFAEQSRMPLQLERKAGAPEDELERVVHAFNAMHTRLQQSFGELQESEYRWKFALEGAGDGVWDWDLRDNRVSFSRQWKAMIGYADGELGDSYTEWEQRVHPDDLPRALADIAAHIEGATPAYANEHRLRCKDGSWKWILARGMIVARDPDGKPLRMIGTHCDISQQKRAEAAMSELNEQLEQRVEARTQELRHAMDQIVESQKLASLGRMVAGVSHELNTPIGNIVLMTSTLSERVGEFGEQAQLGRLTKSGLNQLVRDCAEATAIIANSARRASHMIDSFKRLTIDQSLHTRKEFDLRLTLQDILPPLAVLDPLVNVEIELDIPPGIIVNGYPGHLEQIISNLALNSVKHGFEGRRHGKITIKARQNGEQIELSYADDGHGIAKDVQSHVFEPFYTTKLGRGGPGLGLSIVHSLMQGVFKGTLKLSSEPGAGMKIVFTFPAVTPELEQ